MIERMHGAASRQSTQCFCQASVPNYYYWGAPYTSLDTEYLWCKYLQLIIRIVRTWKYLVGASLSVLRLLIASTIRDTNLSIIFGILPSYILVSTLNV